MADAGTTSERSTLSMGPIGARKRCPVKADAILRKGTIAMRNASGLAIAGAVATTLTPLGRVCETVDATGALDSALYVEYEEGVFKWTNAEASNAFAQAEEGLPAYVINNQTVSKTSTSNSKLGKVVLVESDGVYVQTEKGIV